MIKFTNCKINIGLNIVAKRTDGYHDIVTAMVPIPWHDIIEILPSESDELIVLGNVVDCAPNDNLVYKAYQLMRQNYGLPPAKIILQKVIPDGAGLGGGSGDASAVILAANEMYGLQLETSAMCQLAAKLGADCPFFIYNRPMLATGTGTELHAIDINLDGYSILIAKPHGIRISTRQAYAGVVPKYPEYRLTDLLKFSVEQWQGKITNDFELSIFPIAPELARLKDLMLERGAVYASMTGSGCAIYGIFDNNQTAHSASAAMTDCDTFVCQFGAS